MCCINQHLTNLIKLWHYQGSISKPLRSHFRASCRDGLKKRVTNTATYLIKVSKCETKCTGSFASLPVHISRQRAEEMAEWLMSELMSMGETDRRCNLACIVCTVMYSLCLTIKALFPLSKETWQREYKIFLFDRSIRIWAPCGWRVWLAMNLLYICFK